MRAKEHASCPTDSYRPLAEFPHAGELLLAIRSLSHRFPGQGRHVLISASPNSPDVMIMTLKYGAFPNRRLRHVVPERYSA